MDDRQAMTLFEKKRDFAYELFAEAVKPGGFEALAKRMNCKINMSRSAHGVNQAGLMEEMARIAFQDDDRFEWVITEPVCGTPKIILLRY
jgi:hypothetical protein